MEVLPCNMPCPKCGAETVSRLFYRKGAGIPSEGYNKCRNVYATGMCHSFYAMKDHITHHCQCCQHDWQTPPLSRKKKLTQKVLTLPPPSVSVVVTKRTTGGWDETNH